MKGKALQLGTPTTAPTYDVTTTTKIYSPLVYGNAVFLFSWGRQGGEHLLCIHP